MSHGLLMELITTVSVCFASYAILDACSLSMPSTKRHYCGQAPQLEHVESVGHLVVYLSVFRLDSE